MKVKITLKDPDGVWQSIKSAAESSIENADGLDSSELDEIAESRQKNLEEQCKPWIQYGEYVTIEIDTELGTAKVCEV